MMHHGLETISIFGVSEDSDWYSEEFIPVSKTAMLVVFQRVSAEEKHLSKSPQKVYNPLKYIC